MLFLSIYIFNHWFLNIKLYFLSKNALKHFDRGHKSKMGEDPRHKIFDFCDLKINLLLPWLQLCVRSMASIECIGPMRVALKLRRDMIGLACEALNKMFQTGEEELIEQVQYGKAVL